jgi:hypothetical protein
MKKVVLLMVLAAAAIGWLGLRGGTPERDSDELLVDRLWIDHVPSDERDTVQAFIAMTEHSIGVFGASSTWRGGFEGFAFEADGGRLRLLYPQTGDREVVRTAARPCDERGMDFCLEITGASRGVKRYYSLEGWELPPGTDAAAAFKQRLAALIQR